MSTTRRAALAMTGASLTVALSGLAALAAVPAAIDMNPDADLMALGRKFDAAVTEARRLDRSRKRLFAKYERMATARGLPMENIAERRELMRQTGYSAAVEAFTKPHSEAIRLMRAIYRIQATTLAGFAVKLTAVTFDQCDFDVSFHPCGGADVAERQLLRLMRQVRSVALGEGA